MSSQEFARTCRDLGQFGEAISIDCSEEGVQFIVLGDEGIGNFLLKLFLCEYPGEKCLWNFI